MKLLLTSSGITNKSIEKALLELLGKPFGESRFIYIPTAANPEKGDKGWVDLDMNRIRELGFMSFDVIDISVAPKDVWLPSFQKADLLVFGGGNEEYLLDWIKKTGLKQLLPKLLQTRVYMGISAGSMAAAKKIYIPHVGKLYYENYSNNEYIEGLGFVDFEIRPHLNSPDFPNVRLDYLAKLARQTPATFYAIDDASAVKVDGANISVVSEGKWKKFN